MLIINFFSDQICNKFDINLYLPRTSFKSVLINVKGCMFKFYVKQVYFVISVCRKPHSFIIYFKIIKYTSFLN